MGIPMRTAAASAACLLLAAIAIPAASQEPKTLTGTYAIAGKEAVDPPPDQPKDTHLQLYLSGNAARDLYKAMQVKAMPDECIGSGAQSKFEGGIACTMHAGGKEYECSLAIDIKNQTLDPVYAC